MTITAEIVSVIYEPTHLDTLIEALAEESGQHGDLDMVAICRDAVAGDMDARIFCVEIIINTNY